jgi:hypothetical protein
MRNRETGLTAQYTFRTDRETKNKADAEAKKYGLSRHELVRKVFEEWLNDAERYELLELVRHLQEQVRHLTEQLRRTRKESRKLRTDLKEAAIAILCDAGKLEEHQARTWVQSRLFK